jgi:hypothetical protein
LNRLNYINFTSGTAQPINLPPTTEEFDPASGLMLTVSGWGTTSVRISRQEFLAYSLFLMLLDLFNK